MHILTNERGGGQGSGRLWGTVIGAVVGIVVAVASAGAGTAVSLQLVALGASIGGTVGGIAGALYDTSTAPDTILQQEQLSRIFIQDSGYGGAIPQVFQRYRLAGNVIWLGAKLRHEHRQTEDVGGKGGGPQNVTITYTYTVSMAVMLTDTRLTGPMAGLSKIWSDGTVIYNREQNRALPEEWTFYGGTAVQQADATIETVEGAANTPAYRYRCYIVGKDVELGATGRVPNYTFEVYQTEEVASSKLQVLFVAATNVVWTLDPTGLLFSLDATTQETLTRIILDVENPLYGEAALAATEGGGTLWVANADAYRVWTVSPGGGTTHTDIDTTICSNVAVLGTTAWFCTYNYETAVGHLSRIGAGGEATQYPKAYGTWARVRADATNNVLWVTTIEGDTLERFSALGTRLDLITMAGRAYGIALDGNGTVWLGDHEHDTLVHYSGAGALLATFPTVANPIDVALASDGMVWVAGGTQTARHEPTTGAILRTYGFAAQGTPGTNPWNNRLVASSDGAMFLRDYTSGRLGRFVPEGEAGGEGLTSVIRLPLYPNNIVPDGQGGVWFVSMQANLIGQVDAGMHLRLENTPAQLQNVLTVLAQAAGIPPDALDVSLVPQEPVLLGLLNVEAARLPLEMLCRASQLVPIESSGVLRFLPRQLAVQAATIPQDDLLVTEQSGPGGALVVRTPEPLMPTAMQVLYIDPQQSYQQNTQRATVLPVRDPSLHTNERTMNALIGLSPQQAKRLAQETLDRLWIERTSVQFATTRQYARVEPGDLALVEIRGLTYPVMLTEVAYGRPGMLRCTGIVQSTSVLDEWVPMPGEPPSHDQPPAFIVPTTPLFVHLPALGPQDVASRYHVAYQADQAGWYGASLWQAQDTVDYRRIDATTLQGITGTASLLASHNPALLDDEHVVTVTLTHGQLLSISDTELLGGGNLCVIGPELLQFGRAELTATNTYTLSRLLRGRRGTEHTVGLHTDGEVFVLLDVGVRLLPLLLAERGVEQHYKTVSVAQSLGDVEAVAHTPQAANLVPFSVAYGAAAQEGDQEWVVTWYHRARFNSLWTSDNEEIVADSDIVSYQVRIWDGSTVRRTQTMALAADVRDQVLWVYTAAMQVQDFGSVQTTLTWSVRQRGNYGWGTDHRETVNG